VAKHRFPCFSAGLGDSGGMPRRRQVLPPPRAFAADDTWPYGELGPAAPVAAHYAREIAQRLVTAIGDRNRTEIAAQADLSRSTLHDLTTGRSWPDVVSLAKLETVLQVRLWPNGADT
jgi:hypothetical protein